MEDCYLVYRTDNWHSYKSRDIIGVATKHLKAIEIIQLQVDKDNETLSSDDVFNLTNILQTQNYLGEGEFYIEEVLTDKLL